MESDRAVRCSIPDCDEPVTHKIAAPWSDGRFAELKTYGFACSAHVFHVFRDAEARWLAYEPARGEIIQEVGIYRFQEGKGDRHLTRDVELEKSYYS
jgi:hypothetical protein